MKDKTLEDKLKKAVADEFKYRASQGRTNYSMEEVIYIVNEVIDEVFWEQCEVDTSSDSGRDENNPISLDQLRDLDMRMCVIKGDLKFLTGKVNELSSLLNAYKPYKEPEF
jgi:hypothetical protein